MRIKALGADDIPWNYSPAVHPKQCDCYNCGIYILKFAEALLLDGNGGSTQFSDSREDLEKYRKEIAEQLIECSGKKFIYAALPGIKWLVLYASDGFIPNAKGKQCFRKGKFEWLSCTAALIYATNEAQLPPISSAPSAMTMQRAAFVPSKKPESYLVMQHIKVTSKTRARRCESCKSAFKEKGCIKQRYIIGNYGPRPFFKKTTKTWNDGTRNYYYCVKNCLKTEGM
eukprot:gene10532-11642_t